MSNAQRFVVVMDASSIEARYLDSIKGKGSGWIRAQIEHRLGEIIESYRSIRERISASELVGELAVGLEGGVTLPLKEIDLLKEECRLTGASPATLVGLLQRMEARS